MPELPEVEALAHFLREHAVGRAVGRVDVAALSVLKTFEPPISALTGRTVERAGRAGKFLLLDCDELFLVLHFARAGWLRWSDNLKPSPPKPGKGPLALRVHIGPAEEGTGFDLTEAGTKKSVAAWVVEDPQDVPPIAALGPDAAQIGPDDFADVLGATNARIKSVLTDQKAIAGIGNAYSDEILHAARLSPFATASALTAQQVEVLYHAMRDVLAGAIERSVGQDAARLKGEKRSGLAVHARTGLPCPVCGDSVREVSYAERSFQYCPTCQTGGKILADRRMSRLLR